MQYYILIEIRSEFQTVTAGKYKRTITPFKEVTDEDYKKTKEQVEDIHRMFKDFVHKSRPQLNIDDVATGEIWFGNDAIKVGLCDDIATVDDIMTQFVDNEWNVYELEYKKPLLEKRDITRFIPSGDDDAEVEAGTTNDKNIWERAARWFIQVFASELNSIVRKEVEEGLPKSENSSHRFAAHYSGADKFRVEEEKVSRQR